VDALTTPGRAASIGPVEATRPPYPADDDVAAAMDLVAGLCGPEERAVVAAALDAARASTAVLAADPGGSGLIHGDLHQENVLHRDGVAGAIDFDDSGWGPWLYDPMVTLWDLERHRRYPALRDALLDELAGLRTLPPDVEAHLAALAVLRRVQILIWVLESREHPAFAEWRDWSSEEVDGIRGALAAIR
jgi:Ser/Thr protein kinase RdoA (MazF antagonist)